MNRRACIHTDPAISGGKPIIKGTRLSVELRVDRPANGWTKQMIFASYPDLPAEALPAVYGFMLDTVKDDVFQSQSAVRQAS